MSCEVRFEVLGPVRGRHGEAELDLGSPQQRAVLAMLLLARGRQVPLDGLISGLWGERVPRSATATIRTYISRLRRHFAAHGPGRAGGQIESAGDGYALLLGSALLDLDRFENLHAEGRAAACRWPSSA
jgi:DNA-binding SARP family transcriptional activator